MDPVCCGYPLQLTQGVDFEQLIEDRDSAGEPIDLTGYTAIMQIRVTPESDEVALELTSEEEQIVIDGEEGNVTVLITDEEATDLGANFSGVYSLVLIGPSPNNRRTELLTGTVFVNPGIVR